MGDGRWDEYLALLTKLADMASADIPGRIRDMERPPKPFRDHDRGSVDPAMSSAVVAFLKDPDAIRGRDDELVGTGRVALPETAAVEEELRGKADERMKSLF